MKLRFEQKLTLGFFFLFLGVCVVGYETYKGNAALVENNAWVRHTEEVLRQSEKVFNLTKDVGGERSYAATHDAEFLTPLKNAEKNVFVEIAYLKSLTADNPAQQQRVDSITLFASNKMDVVHRSIALIDANRMDEANALIASRQNKFWMDKIRSTIKDLEQQEENLLKQRQNAYLVSRSSFDYTIIGLFIFILLLLAITFAAIMYNLARRRRLQNELTRSNTFLTTILENIPNMIFVKNGRDLRFVLFNKAGEQLLGHPRTDLLGKNDYDFFPREQADFFTAKDRDVLKNGTLLDIAEEPIETENGRRWLHTKKIPIVDETGKSSYLLGISADITEEKARQDEIKQLNQELARTVNQLMQANKDMEAFTYSVSHDLRAPLRIIDGFGEILAKEHAAQLTSEGQRTLQVIMNNARHMGELIDDLLNLSRLGRAQISVKLVSMKDLVHDVTEAMQVINHNGSPHIEVKPLPTAEGDPGLLRQVWVNLISNAIKYSRKKEKPEIEIGSFDKAGNTVYYIKDNGVGFDMQYAGKLFGVFQRLHKPSEFEGTGVGLALVHRIISKHGGRIWANALVNEGATFYFTLKE
jgi:PAS domain S-box-containing protein